MPGGSVPPLGIALSRRTSKMGLADLVNEEREAGMLKRSFVVLALGAAIVLMCSSHIVAGSTAAKSGTTRSVGLLPSMCSVKATASPNSCLSVSMKRNGRRARMESVLQDEIPVKSIRQVHRA